MPARHRGATFGFIMASFSFGVVIGPMAGAVLSPLAASWFAVGGAAFNCVYTVLLLPESLSAEARKLVRPFCCMFSILPCVASFNTTGKLCSTSKDYLVRMSSMAAKAYPCSAPCCYIRADFWEHVQCRFILHPSFACGVKYTGYACLNPGLAEQQAVRKALPHQKLCTLEGLGVVSCIARQRALL